MKIVTISGSSRIDSSNTRLLRSLVTIMPEHSFVHFDRLPELPLFRAEQDAALWPALVLQLRGEIVSADAVIIATPEYIHNIPAQLKNALEWLTSSGELVGKSVLPITYTPSSPRWEKAMQSLLWSLEALDARIVTSLSLFQNALQIVDGTIKGDQMEIEILKEAINLL